MAAGSTTTYGTWEPRVCCLCALPNNKTRDGAHRFDFNHLTNVGRSWHVACEQVHGWPANV